MSQGAPPSVVAELVTVILPVRNRPELVREAVASVVAQTYRPVELLIVDDGSTDATPAVLAELAHAHADVVRVLRGETSVGPGAARERARQEARGGFLQYLDSDDLLLPDKLTLHVEALRGAEPLAAAYGRTHLKWIERAEREPTPQKRTAEQIQRLFPDLLRGRVWDTSTPLYTRALADAAGPWLDASYDEDWAYEAAVARQRPQLVQVEADVSVTRHHPGERQGMDHRQAQRRWGDRERAQRVILDHAIAAEVPLGDPDRAHYARALFHMAREAAAQGCGRSARALLSMAREADPRRGRWQRRTFRAVGALIGMRRAARLAARTRGVVARPG